MSQFYVGITDTSWYSLLREDYNNVVYVRLKIHHY